MKRFIFWQSWLFVTSIIIITFGIAMAFANQSIVFNILFNQQINPLFWGTNKISAETIAFQRFVYGVLGATMTGWGIFLAFIIQTPFRKHQSWAWNCIALGMLMWFSMDTFISITSGVLFNAIFNTIIFMAILFPLIFTRKTFQ